LGYLIGLMTILIVLVFIAAVTYPYILDGLSMNEDQVKEIRFVIGILGASFGCILGVSLIFFFTLNQYSPNSVIIV
jgi:hypothetical protein